MFHEIKFPTPHMIPLKRNQTQHPSETKSQRCIALKRVLFENSRSRKYFIVKRTGKPFPKRIASNPVFTIHHWGHKKYNAPM